ncbi:MAG: hypothetical protein HY343_08300 [Lentisphaerae bacterium]|nr:hypothetical protein [Lentisphaerota bacterium]
MNKLSLFALYMAGLVLFAVSAFLPPCTSVGYGFVAAMLSLIFFVFYPFHATAIIAVLLSPFMLWWILKGRIRWLWIVLAGCLPAIWLSPITTAFPNVHTGYFVWTISVSLVALSLGLMTHQARPLKINRRRFTAGWIAVLAFTYFLTHPHCILPRFWQLQFLGHVPENSKYADDWKIADETYWWGNSLDPAQFWSNKVVWLDSVAEAEALRHGRSYPPMPFRDPSVADRSDRATHGDGMDLSGAPVIYYYSSERERAFWDKFGKTHPRPPKQIEREQLGVADSMMHHRHTLATDSNLVHRLRLTEKSIRDSIAWRAHTGREVGYPVECYDEKALFWSYVLNKRQEYEKIKQPNSFGRTYVDSKYITEPLSAQDIREANAWKVAYLRRLRLEGTDHSYIRAYMNAWKLTVNDLASGER